MLRENHSFSCEIIGKILDVTRLMLYNSSVKAQGAGNEKILAFSNFAVLATPPPLAP
jgi:hypothetical protein